MSKKTFQVFIINSEILPEYQRLRRFNFISNLHGYPSIFQLKQLKILKNISLAPSMARRTRIIVNALKGCRRSVIGGFKSIYGSLTKRVAKLFPSLKVRQIEAGNPNDWKFLLSNPKTNVIHFTTNRNLSKSYSQEHPKVLLRFRTRLNKFLLCSTKPKTILLSGNSDKNISNFLAFLDDVGKGRDKIGQIKLDISHLYFTLDPEIKKKKIYKLINTVELTPEFKAGGFLSLLLTDEHFLANLESLATGVPSGSIDESLFLSLKEIGRAHV